MNEIEQFFREIGAYVWFIVLGVTGGTVNYLSRIKRDENLKFSVIEMLGEWFASGFIALMTAYICAYAEFPFPLIAVACGISGHLAGRIMYMLDARGGDIIDSMIDKLIGKK